MVRGATSTPDSASRLFGFDMFVSFALGPPPRGAYSYASDVARRLRDRDFTVFFSEDDAPPGDHLDRALITALRRSKILIVVVNRHTLERPGWVRKEVEEFIRHDPARPVVAISIDGALTEAAVADPANAWLQCQGRIWVDESREALDSGAASDSVLDRLTLASRRTKSTAKWRWLVRTVMVALAGLTAVALVGWTVAQRNASRALAGETHAREELRRAVTLRLAADVKSLLARHQPGDDEQAALQALAAVRLQPSPEVFDAIHTFRSQRQRLERIVPISPTAHHVAISGDGGRIAVVGADDIQIWDARTLLSSGAPLHADGMRVASVALNSDGSQFIAGDDRGTLRLWDTKTGLGIADLITGSGKALYRVAFSPDGRTVAAAGPDAIWLCDVGSRAVTALIENRKVDVAALQFSNDGRFLVSGDFKGLLALWDVTTHKPVAANAHSGHVFALAVSPDSRLVASVDADGTLRMWDAHTLRPMSSSTQAGVGMIKSLAFSPDGETLASGSQSATQLWNARTMQPIGEAWEGHGFSRAISFTADGRHLISASTDGTIRSWNAAADVSDHLTLFGHTGRVTTIACCSHGLFVTGSDDRSVRVWSLDRGEQLEPPLLSGKSAVIRVAFGDGGDTVVAVDIDHVMRWWNLQSRRLISQAHTEFAGGVDGAGISGDGRLVALGGYDVAGLVEHNDWRARIWNRDAGRVVGTRVLDEEGLSPLLTMSADGRRVAYAGLDRPLGIWDLGTDRTRQLQAEGRFLGLAFTVDGRRLAAAEGAGVRLWNLATDPPNATDLVQGGGGLITGVAFSQDSRYLVTSSADHSIRFWDSSSGRPLGSRLQQDDAAESAAFSPDGRYAVSGDTYGHVHIWPAPDRWIEILCETVARNMTRDEWAKWVSPDIGYVKQCPKLPDPPDESLPHR